MQAYEGEARGMRVELESFSLSYDGRGCAVQDLDLSIASGALFGLIGPNGAGKSTTLKAIAGLLVPSAGRVLLDGARFGEAAFAKRRRSIGFVGESLPFERGVSAQEHLYFFARAHGMQRAEAKARVHEVLTMLDLQAKATADCRALSKGMRQRLSLGRAWIHRPSLLILDEPADGLDPQGRRDLRKILRKIHAEGATVIISSHILRELDDLCDEVAILQAGSLAISGKVNEIQERFAARSNQYRVRCILDPSQSQDAAIAAFERALEPSNAVILKSECAGKYLDAQITLQGAESASAALIRHFVQAEIQICSLERLGSRLEDVYEQLSDPTVN